MELDKVSIHQAYLGLSLLRDSSLIYPYPVPYSYQLSPRPYPYWITPGLGAGVNVPGHPVLINHARAVDNPV